jgi:tRNA (mo5U34)-methyltransferase
MIDLTRHFEYLSNFKQLSNVVSNVESKVKDTIQHASHGDLQSWLEAIDKMPDVTPSIIDLDLTAPVIGSADDIDEKTKPAMVQLLKKLHPWRKGPFNLFGINIDAEWRSDMKWQRLADQIRPLKDKFVADIGSGNGYYLLRMLGAGAKAAVGIDPHLLYLSQFTCLNKYLRTEKAAVLPLKDQEIPRNLTCFDTVFSMGVLYHNRYPLDHLKHLRGLLVRGGQLVIETLIIDSTEPELLKPKQRYAKMRNVWNIPSPPLLNSWIKQAGFSNIQTIDITPTTTAEQRKTEWMWYESLADFLDPEDSQKTIEGYQGPVRAITTAEKV